ncbi:MAG: metallophosphoesterase, partial [Alphaproteobacteria bacterium]|nr:metallophosphoesterase [Alphaproteobacteria bacterium]
QDCNDIRAWPFPQLALSAARLNPDLVIDVGDYLYRENPCPTGVKGCAGSPFGDRWTTWKADFFAPAAPLLAAAAFVFVRGNHEDCRRSGAGFMRLLGPEPYDAASPCVPHLKPMAVPTGAMTLVVFDDASAPDTSIAQELVPSFRSDIQSLATFGPAPLWLVMHRPIFGLIKGPFGIPVGGNLTMITALGGDLTALSHASLMLSGHIHAFEALNYVAPVPPQFLAGNGGDNLDVTPRDLTGGRFQGSSGVIVHDGLSLGGFGFLLLTKDGPAWDADLYRADGTRGLRCKFASARIDCPSPPQ